MLILKSLTFSGIGRFVEEQTVDFTQLGSLVQVDGQNNNTGGSSGAGKSTIFKALEFLLGLNDVSNTVLQSRLTKSPMSVIGLFDLDGVPLKIERNKKLLIDINGEVITGSSKLTEEKLDQLIGMSRDLFRKILHKRQGEGGFFLDMGPSDVHKFLTNCLSLEKEQSKIVTLDGRISDLTNKDIVVKSALESNKMGLEATQSAISSLGSPPVLEIDPKAIAGLKTTYYEAATNHQLVKDSNKKEMAELEASRPQIKTVPFDRHKMDSIDKELSAIVSQIHVLDDNERQRCALSKFKISELQTEIGKLNNLELSRQSEVKNKISSIRLDISGLQAKELARQAEAKSNITLNQLSFLKFSADVSEATKAKTVAISLAAELNKVRASLCPTCEQGWITDTAKAKELEIIEKLKDCKKIMAAGQVAEKELLILGEDRKRLNLELESKPIPEVDALMIQAKQLALDLQPKSIPEIDTINNQIEKLKLDSQPQVIPEVLELMMKKDFKNKELTALRQEELDHQFKENSKSQLILADFAQKQAVLRQQQETTLNFVQEEEKKALMQYEQANNTLKSFEENERRFKDSYNKLQSQMTKYQDQINEKISEHTSVLEEIELATESKKAIKSYLSCSFEDALDSIGDVATRFIRAIPNMSTATIQFEGLKETKEGKIKEEVTCLISMDGEIGIPIKSLSGGEKSSTDLAIDLAVIKFIEERTGKGIDLFVLDEAFTGLDSKNILEALEMLKECSSDKRLLIVDHNPEAAQFIENRLTVIRDGLTSKVVQQ